MADLPLKNVENANKLNHLTLKFGSKFQKYYPPCSVILASILIGCASSIHIN